MTIGIDIGDQWSHYCRLNDTGDVIEEGRFRTTAGALAKHFADIDSVRIAVENGTHSIWINEQLRGYGHEVIVANVRELHAICRNDRKSDRVDAEKACSVRAAGSKYPAPDYSQECCLTAIAYRHPGA